MLDCHETIVLIRSLWTIARTPDIPEQITMMRMVQRMWEAGAITPQVSLDAIEEIEDFYERHIHRVLTDGQGNPANPQSLEPCDERHL